MLSFPPIPASWSPAAPVRDGACVRGVRGGALAPAASPVRAAVSAATVPAGTPRLAASNALVPYLQTQPHVSAMDNLKGRRGGVVKAVKRVTADLSISVESIADAIEAYCAEVGSYDVATLFKTLPRNGKQNPRLCTCVRFAPLYASMAGFCVNGQLPPKKTVVALSLLGSRVSINFTKLSDTELFNDLSVAVRTQFVMYRKLLYKEQFRVTTSNAP
jgi:hypothetical protein